MFVAGFASLFADRSCGDVFINHKLHPAPWLDPVNDRAALVVVFRLFCSLFHRDGSKLNCCLGLWRPSCSVTLCLFVSFAQSILKTFCFYASGGGELSRFSQMLSYSHLLGEERAILGFSIYIRLKIADFCVVRRNAVSSRARTQQVFHKNALYWGVFTAFWSCRKPFILNELVIFGQHERELCQHDVGLDTNVAKLRL